MLDISELLLLSLTFLLARGLLVNLVSHINIIKVCITPRDWSYGKKDDYGRVSFDFLLSLWDQHRQKVYQVVYG